MTDHITDDQILDFVKSIIQDTTDAYYFKEQQGIPFESRLEFSATRNAKKLKEMLNQAYQEGQKSEGDAPYQPEGQKSEFALGVKVTERSEDPSKFQQAGAFQGLRVDCPCGWYHFSASQKDVYQTAKSHVLYYCPNNKNL